ncbi:MAG TPA: transglycosylase domain-containing protein [Thermoanaerobaculia bacterium]|nr:transglycosylase domain-containing protein [Thermoanaerobaculia bacterium]
MKKLSVLCCLLSLALIAAWVRLGPVPPIKVETTPIITDRNGVVLYEPLSRGGTRSAWIASVPDNVARATIAAEDRRFEHHVGVDPIAVVRAAVHDVRHMRIVEGGSTITQQVAKLILPPRKRTVVAKIREAIVALRLEHRYSKSEILTMYVNLAPYGEQTVGIARASDRYFGCAPEQLTVAQAAYLAALPQRPSTESAMSRQREVLRRMNASESDFDERLVFNRGAHPLLAPHFVQHVLAAMNGAPASAGKGFAAGSEGPAAATEGPAKAGAPFGVLSDVLSGVRSGVPSGAPAIIRTSLDARLQRQVEGIIAAHRASLVRHGAHSVAVLVIDNRTREPLAWEGSGDYFGESFGGAIDGVTTPRQPGSALKPFTYAVAFEQGLTPATVIADVPSHFPTAEEGVVYTPRNYDGRFRGPMRIRMALAGSENVPAVAVLSRIGPATLLRFLREAGFTDLTHTAGYYGVGLTLGDAEVTLEQLVRAYSIFPRGGDGVVSQRTAFWITDILSDPHAREFIFGSGGSLDFPFPVAVKTGTSQAYHDNWTVGYTHDVTVGVWVGNFDRTALRNSSGVTGAAPIFHDVMLAAAKDHGPIVDRPADLELQPICALSGHRPSIDCPNVEQEWLPANAPVEFCSWHHADRVELPAEYRALETPRFAVRTSPTLRILAPANNTTFLIDPTLHRQFQALKLKATSTVTWSVDGRKSGDEWPLRAGEHTIVATDSLGNRDSVKITVR